VCGSFIKWKKFVEGSARDWLATAEKTNEGKRQSALQKAMQFLSELLAEKPLPQQYIEEQYTNEGYSYSTIRRAKAELQIKSLKKGRPSDDGEQEWVLSLPNATNEGMD
jgi:putative DNA primase/helicase